MSESPLPAPSVRRLRIGGPRIAGAGSHWIPSRRYDATLLFDRACPGGMVEELEVHLADGLQRFARPLLSDAEHLLRVGGRAVMRVPEGPARDELALDAFEVLGERFAATTTAAGIELEKRAGRAVGPAAQRRWSIVVPSGGGNDARLRRLLASVDAAGIVDPDVIIVGPQPAFPLPAAARWIPFGEHPTDPRFDICAKKNLGIREARHESVLVMHDRFALSPGWATAAESWREDWDVMAIPACFADGGALDVWTEHAPSRAGGRAAIRYRDYGDAYPFDLASLHHRRLADGEYSARGIVNGGVFAVRRARALATPLPGSHRWGELEDAMWSLALQHDGVVYRLARGAAVINDPQDHHRAERTDGVVARVRGAGLAARKRVLGRVAAVLQDVTRPQDLYARRRVFAAGTRVVAASDLAAVGEALVSGAERVVVVETERVPTLGPLLRVVRRAARAGQRIELASETPLISYFRRNADFRHGEMVMLEVGLWLGARFEVQAIRASALGAMFVELCCVAAAVADTREPVLVASAPPHGEVQARMRAALADADVVAVDVPPRQPVFAARAVLVRGSVAPGIFGDRPVQPDCAAWRAWVEDALVRTGADVAFITS